MVRKGGNVETWSGNPHERGSGKVKKVKKGEEKGEEKR